MRVVQITLIRDVWRSRGLSASDALQRYTGVRGGFVSSLSIRGRILLGRDLASGTLVVRDGRIDENLYVTGTIIGGQRVYERARP